MLNLKLFPQQNYQNYAHDVENMDLMIIAIDRIIIPIATLTETNRRLIAIIILLDLIIMEVNLIIPITIQSLIIRVKKSIISLEQMIMTNRDPKRD